jgi:hypothetical protein
MRFWLSLDWNRTVRRMRKSWAFGLWSLVFVLRTLCLVLCAWINVRLEVGPAHRCDLGEIMRVSNETMLSGRLV